MKMKAFTKIEVLFGTVIFLLLLMFVFSQTAAAFTKAREKVTKDNLAELSAAINVLINNKTDLQKTFDLCRSEFCEVNNTMIQKFVNEKTDPPSQILSEIPVNYEGQNFRLKITASNSYILEGTSAASSDLCWIESTEKIITNTTSDLPSNCL